MAGVVEVVGFGIPARGGLIEDRPAGAGVRRVGDPVAGGVSHHVAEKFSPAAPPDVGTRQCDARRQRGQGGIQPETDFPEAGNLQPSRQIDDGGGPVDVGIAGPAVRVAVAEHMDRIPSRGEGRGREGEADEQTQEQKRTAGGGRRHAVGPLCGAWNGLTGMRAKRGWLPGSLGGGAT